MSFICISLCTRRLVFLKLSTKQAQLFDSKTMPHTWDFENLGHTTKNTIFRLVKLLADPSTRRY